MKKNWLRFFVLIILSVGFCPEVFAVDDYPLVLDKRNYRKSSGGKSVQAQGRVIEDSLRTRLFNEDAITDYQAGDENWRYVVSMNCARGSRSISDIAKAIAKLIPDDQQDRIALILGVNEKVTVDNPVDYAPSWTDILGTADIDEELEDLKFPILLSYFQWTSFREPKDDSDMSPQAIRKAIAKALAKQSERQRNAALGRLRAQDKTHQFPFGNARRFLLQNATATKFVKDMHQAGCLVYVQTQDSDFVSFDENPVFGDFQGGDNERLISADQDCLFAKYDALIAHQHIHNGRWPIFIGGAHVYSPEEDLKDLDKPSLNRTPPKQWTRLGSEAGNNIKQLIGQLQPKGLYPHEPNTLILSPYSAQELLKDEEAKEWQAIYERLKDGVTFGIDSENQEFMRTVFKGASDAICQQGIVFSATTVLSTSMKRGKGKKPFTIRFGGKYNAVTKRFSGYTQDDFAALRGMSQEHFTTNDWGSVVTTSFAAHRSKDARKHVYEAWRRFDPIELFDPSDTNSFSHALVSYSKRIEEQRDNVRALFTNLKGHYGKLKEGKEIAFQIISAGWECGYMLRFMFLNHLQPPAGTEVPALNKRDKEVLGFFAMRFNFVGGLKNPFVADLLGMNNLAPALSVKSITQAGVGKAVTYLYDANDENKSRTAQDVGVDPRSVPKLMDEEAPIAWKKVARSLGTRSALRARFGSPTRVEKVHQLLGGH